MPREDFEETKQPSEFKLKFLTKQLHDISTALNLTSEVTITDIKGNIIYANDRFCELSKYSKEELIGQNHRLIKSGYHRPEVYQDLWDTIAQGKVWHNEIKNKAKDGTFYWADSTIVPFLDEHGAPYQYIAIRKDITARKEHEEMIRRLAFEDLLTKLPNRRSLENELNNICKNKEEFAVLLIGIDQFNSINNHHGFKTGDKVLIEFSKRLINIMKDKSGFIARMGGDEFIVILKELDHVDRVTELAKTILQSVNYPFRIKDNLLYITASIGISCFQTDGNDSDTLVEKAHIALSEGKIYGRNNYYFFTDLMDVESFKRFSLQNDIRKALENDEFFIEYQPIIETHSQQISRAEALIRWEHPRWGTVPPKEFISIAEESGIIIKLGEWILRNVCEQINKWSLKGIRQVPIAINFSPIQFSDVHMTDMVLKIINETGVNPKWLEFEITENIIIDNSNDVLKKMTILASKGILFSIDDFGTGYSSLKILNTLPFHFLKIDRSFIKDLQYNKGSLLITKTILQLAHSFNLKVIAEGVENTEQLTILNEEKCDYIQGYLFSKPVNPIVFEQLIIKNKALQTNEPRLNQSKEQNRKYFRISFKYPLLGTFTVKFLNNRPVSIGNSSILIENIGAGGLCYLSQIRFPLNKGFILEISTQLLNRNLVFSGKNVWVNEVDHDLYQYGFEFILEESERTILFRLLNQLQVKYKKDILLPDSSFIKIENKANFFKKRT